VGGHHQVGHVGAEFVVRTGQEGDGLWEAMEHSDREFIAKASDVCSDRVIEQWNGLVSLEVSGRLT
jgi:hypothetical protein